MHHGILEPGRRDRCKLPERRDRALGLLGEELGQAVRLVRRPPRQQLVEHGAEGVDVGGRSHLVARSLLGRQVGGCAEHGPGLRQLRSVERAGDPKVGDFERPVRHDQQVLRLDVAVNEAGIMRGLETPAGL